MLLAVRENCGLIFTPDLRQPWQPFVTYRSIAVTMGATNTPALAAAAQSAPILQPKFLVFRSNAGVVVSTGVVLFDADTSGTARW